MQQLLQHASMQDVGSTPTQGNIDAFQGMGQIALRSPCTCGSCCYLQYLITYFHSFQMHLVVLPAIEFTIFTSHTALEGRVVMVWEKKL